MSTNEKRPGYIISVLTNKCPRCREGNIYPEPNPYKLKTVVKMSDQCPLCGQPTEIEVGFYYGTSYVSYVLAVVLCAVSFILWWLVIGFSFEDSRFFWWMGVNAVLLVALQPVLMRLSRTLWLSWFVKYDPHWKDNAINKESLERIVPEQMGNW
ncbi:MAG: DUF983 domain-containing protein [Chitinophagaceae bacterium]